MGVFKEAKERYRENIFEPDNHVIISGKLGEINFSHVVKRKKYYSSVLQIPRLSGVVDEVPIIMGVRRLNTAAGLVGKNVKVMGVIRSRNNYGKDLKKHLHIYVYANEIVETEELQNDNILLINGYVCKPIVLRTTPLGKEIADLHLAINRENGESDYIPCIVWHEKAKAISQIQVGRKVKILGRLQSREYNKMLDNGEVVIKVAHEVSVFGYDL